MDQQFIIVKAFLLSIELGHGEVEHIVDIYIYIYTLFVKVGCISKLEQWKEQENTPQGRQQKNRHPHSIA